MIVSKLMTVQIPANPPIKLNDLITGEKCSTSSFLNLDSILQVKGRLLSSGEEVILLEWKATNGLGFM